MIRNIIIFFFVIIFFLSLFTISLKKENIKKNNIYGYWEGNNEKEKFIFEFKDDNYCNIRIIDRITNNELLLTGKFELDFFKSPKSLSIRNIPQLDYPLHTIFEFLNHDLIKIGSFSPKWKLRPISFDPIASVIVKRKYYQP